MSKHLDLDAALAGWSGHPARTDQEWDEAADRIVAAATARPAPAGDAPTTEALFSMPTLDPEPGEPVTAGVATMSESDDDKPRPSLRRPSLKELAERVSKAPPPASAPPSSLSAVAQPPSSPPSSLGGMGPTSAAPGSLAALARASQPVIAERGSQPPASASQPPMSASQPPMSGSQPPMSGSQPPMSAAPASAAAPAPASNVVPIQQAKKSSGGATYLTVGMLVVGLASAAAGGFIYLRADKSGVVSRSQTSEPEAAADTKKGPEGEAKAKQGDEDGKKPEGGAAGDGAIDLAALSDATAEPASTDDAAPAAPLGSGAIALGGPKPDAPVKIEPTGDLETAMKDAVGADDQKKTEAEPAAAETKPGGALPDRPPQGSVTSAVSGSMGAAKGCVAGADDVSRATITFGSSGAVQSVSVSGWAAGKPAAGCIKSAFQGANVGPFSRPTFTFGVTIRP